VTRDPGGYRGAALPIVDPGTAVELLSKEPPEAVEERPRRALPRKVRARR
jgi:hypothetical protein